MKALKRYSLACALLATGLFCGAPGAQAQLTSGTTYLIHVNEVNSDGSLTDTGLSTNTTADANGKITFSMSGIPDSDQCNFMVVSVDNVGGSASDLDDDERTSIVPCPDPNNTLPLGISEMTATQATAMIDAMAAAGSDDPILAVFGNTIVRSPGMDTSELAAIATVAIQGITGTGGFVDTLTNGGVTAAQLTAYRSAIVSRLADANSGYTKLMKDAVDQSFTVGSAEELKKRGEAAALLLQVLVQAATDADFDQELVLEAFNAMGAVVMPLFDQAMADGDLSADTMAMVNSTVGGGIDKLRMEKEIEAYEQALTTLGASGDDVDQFNTAASTLAATARSVFQTFEQVFDGSETEAEVEAAQQTMQQAMNQAFTTFMTDTAASDTRIATLRDAVNQVMGGNYVTTDDFKFYNETGQSNWPIMMVVVAEWVNEAITNNGGDVGNTVVYTRDSATIPANLLWIGSCDTTGLVEAQCNAIAGAGGNAYWDNSGAGECVVTDSESCANATLTWTAQRTNFAGMGMPGSYAAIFGIQEDIMVREFTRYDAFDTAEQAGQNGDEAQMMELQQQLEAAFRAGLEGIAANITGTNPDGDPITAAEQKALVTLLKSPQL